jgi:hypothetical protein
VQPDHGSMLRYHQNDNVEVYPSASHEASRIRIREYARVLV